MDQPVGIRPFIGAKDFAESRAFYRDLGFEEVVLENNFSVFKMGAVAFYLQDYYIKDWVDNTMLFLEVKDVEKFWAEIQNLQLPLKYPSCRIKPVVINDWGSECFIHDPSGILWHVGQFH